MSRLALLRTACGCERMLRVDSDSPHWRIPIHWNSRNPFTEMADDMTAAPIIARKFEWRGKYDTRGTERVPIFVEQPEPVAVTPPLPMESMSTGEWADAVARFRSIVRGDIPQMDYEFMRQHDGATMIMHKSGVLVGAFYPSPGWDHSEDAVRVFSELRRILEER